MMKLLARSVLLATLVGIILLSAAWAAETPPARSLDSEAEIERGFLDPPESARPWVYWFWLNGNITREGITADLEAMKRVGIGGVLIMEVDQGAPLGPVDFISPRWREMFKHVVAEAGRLGLEVNMNNDAGWNGSGGPWIKPEQSMQKVVWSETAVTGPQSFKATLPQPETVAGYYRDIAVLAVPTPGDYRIENIKVKACYDIGHVGPPATAELPPEMVIPRDRIVDLTERIDAQGRLAWDAPAGNWTVLRFGHTSTGVQNAPAPASGRGLECDKLSKEGVEANFNGMMAKLIADVGPAAGKALAATHVDSWENGAQNWTARMREEFRGRRGYDLLPFLPAMTGRVVDSLEISERFLWDLRQTISEMVVDYYAGHLRELARQHGLRFTIEAYGSPCDNLPYAGRCDEPMGEFWIGGGAIETCRGMASAAHIYGLPIVGAEAFTAGDAERWREHPASIKALGDRAFCEGINRFVFHRYALQPWEDREPGMTMGPWGIHYERTQTWWEQTPAWHEYLARCQYLLRQGLFVADICYLQPETSPQGFQEHDRHGYNWDQCTAEVVLSRMTVREGRITLPDGMSYRLLVLPNARSMTPGLLAKIGELVKAGATVVGPRPLRSPSLSGHPECDREVERLATAIWGDGRGDKAGEHRFGQGRVVWGLSPEQVLARSGVQPDFTSRQRLRFIHRATGGTDLYFVSNPQPHELTSVATFRVSGKTPELWWPDTGRMERAAMYQEQDGRTSVLLPLGPSGSVFVVFREKGTSSDSLAAISRDGQMLWNAAAAAAPRAVVQKAAYGVPGDPQRTRDVREKVQRKVDAGDYSFRVSELAAGDDPAEGVVKTLVVDYTIDGKPFTVKGQDSSIVHLTADAMKISVQKATYGVLGDAARTRDVRDKVQRLVDAGESSFQVARMAEGDDPAYLVVKTLVLEYTIDGRPVTVSGTDPETIDLAMPAATERIVELQRGDDGSLRLDAWQAGRYSLATASGGSQNVEVAAIPTAVDIAGPWELRFAGESAASKRLKLKRLTSWSELSDPAAKYYSGTATYSTSFTVPQGLLGKGRRLDLDLGDVQVMARVKLNGSDLGLMWKPPFRADVTGLIAAGENRLEVEVVNLWPNRMIGDEQLPEDSQRNTNGTLKEWPAWLAEGKPSPTGRQTFTSWRLWKKDDPLLKSGLLGPVRIVAAESVELDH